MRSEVGRFTPEEVKKMNEEGEERMTPEEMEATEARSRAVKDYLDTCGINLSEIEVSGDLTPITYIAEKAQVLQDARRALEEGRYAIGPVNMVDMKRLTERYISIWRDNVLFWEESLESMKRSDVVISEEEKETTQKLRERYNQELSAALEDKESNTFLIEVLRKELTGAIESARLHRLPYRKDPAIYNEEREEERRKEFEEVRMRSSRQAEERVARILHVLEEAINSKQSFLYPPENMEQQGEKSSNLH